VQSIPFNAGEMIVFTLLTAFKHPFPLNLLASLSLNSKAS
jgi:hypothetical protein